MEDSAQAAAKATGSVRMAPLVYSGVLCDKVRCMFYRISRSNVARQKILREGTGWGFVWGRQKTRELVGGRERATRKQVWPKQGWWERSINHGSSWKEEYQGPGGCEQASIRGWEIGESKWSGSECCGVSNWVARDWGIYIFQSYIKIQNFTM